jgi:hypothetical protein
MCAVPADIDAMYDQDDQVEAALQPKKKRGKLTKAEKEAEKQAEEAAAAAAAAAAETAAADAAAASPGSSSSDEEDGSEEAAAAAADEAEGIEDDDESDYDFGILGDPAPCVILRLRDNAETRAVWPHQFELYYKVSAA